MVLYLVLMVISVDQYLHVNDMVIHATEWASGYSKYGEGSWCWCS